MSPRDLSRSQALGAGIVAFSAISAVALKSMLVAHDPDHEPVAGLIRQFGFFTIWANVFVAVVMSAAALGRLRAPGWFTAATVYIVAVCVIYWLLLARLHQVAGLDLVANHLLHSVTPAATALYWVALAPKAGLRWRDAGLWVVFPALYGVIAIGRGLTTGFYPYPFLNVDRIGVLQASVNLAVLALVFGVFGCALIAVSRGFARIKPAGD